MQNGRMVVKDARLAFLPEDVEDFFLFGNCGHRLIDDLEQGEQDSERLANLFQMDHLATRMRRNSENLLVLAGHEVSRRWTQSVGLVDVLRAAVSEIEQYERVTLNVQPGIAVRGLDESVSFYRDVLGLPDVPMDDADGAKIVGLAAGESLVELLEGASPDSPITKFVGKRGPGIHHVCFEVDDLEATLARCRAHGIRLIDEHQDSGT